MYMHNAFAMNASCSFYHQKTPCLIKTKQKYFFIYEINNAAS